MLGHSSTKMTQHYAKVLNQTILKDMQEVEKLLFDKKQSVLRSCFIESKITGLIKYPFLSTYICHPIK